MTSTPADVKEHPDTLVSVIDMPDVKPDKIKAQVEDDNVLVVSGERKRAEEKDVKYVLMECRVGKFMRRGLCCQKMRIWMGYRRWVGTGC